MSGIKKVSFGEYIRTLRVEKNLPLRKIAAELDIDPSTLGKIERNERKATNYLIKKIAKIFQIDEKILKVKYMSDKISYELLNENLGTEVLKVAEERIKYLTKNKQKSN